MGLGLDGTLCAFELSTRNPGSNPFYRPYAGEIERQTGPTSQEDVATGLNYAIHLGFGPAGGLYVATPAIGANAGEGSILRLDPAVGPVSASEVAPPTRSCLSLFARRVAGGRLLERGTR